MQYSDIIQKVQTTAQIESPKEAQKAIQAVLQTLKERILGDEASNLAAQLPEEVGQYLRGPFRLRQRGLHPRAKRSKRP